MTRKVRDGRAASAARRTFSLPQIGSGWHGDRPSDPRRAAAAVARDVRETFGDRGALRARPPDRGAGGGPRRLGTAAADRGGRAALAKRSGPHTGVETQGQGPRQATARTEAAGRGARSRRPALR